MFSDYVKPGRKGRCSPLHRWMEANSPSVLFSLSIANQITSLSTSTAHHLLLRILPRVLRWEERLSASLLNEFRENMFLMQGIVLIWKWMSGKGKVVPVQRTGRRQGCAETRENLVPVNSCTAVSECRHSMLGGAGRRRSWRSFSATWWVRGRSGQWGGLVQKSKTSERERERTIKGGESKKEKRRLYVADFFQ